MAQIIESQIYHINKVIISSNRNCKAGYILGNVVNFLVPKLPDIDIWEQICEPLYVNNFDNLNYDSESEEEENEDENLINKTVRISIITNTNVVYIDESSYCHGNILHKRFTIYTINGEHDSDRTRELYENLKNHVETIWYNFYEDSFIIEPPGEVL